MHRPAELLLAVWNWVCRHKYLVVTAVFLLTLLFDGENSLFSRVQHWRELRRLRAEIEEYNAIYEETSARLEELKSSPAAVEKVAREQYFMKGADEDVFVFE